MTSISLRLLGEAMVIQPHQRRVTRQLAGAAQETGRADPIAKPLQL